MSFGGGSNYDYAAREQLAESRRIAREQSTRMAAMKKQNQLLEQERAKRKQAQELANQQQAIRARNQKQRNAQRYLLTGEQEDNRMLGSGSLLGGG